VISFHNPLPFLSVQKDGWTALMFAADHGHELAVKALIEGGADVAQMDVVRKSGQSDGRRVDSFRSGGGASCILILHS
jgi:ankyrin repeat protein